MDTMKSTLRLKFIMLYIIPELFMDQYSTK